MRFARKNTKEFVEEIAVQNPRPSGCSSYPKFNLSLDTMKVYDIITNEVDPP